MSQLGSITAEKEKQMDLERQRFQEVKAKMPALSPECWRSRNIKERPELPDTLS